MVAEPAAAAMTRPDPLTVATTVLLLAQVTVRPESGLPLASFGIAVSCTVCPAWSDTENGVTVTEATGTWATVTAAVPLCPSLVAVIVATPAAIPVTMPLVSTVATPDALLCQLTLGPGIGFPAVSCGV